MLSAGGVAALKARVCKIFPRKNADIQALFDDKLQEWVRSLAALYPFWFLRVTPERLVLPPAASLLDGWFQRGWLRTTAGQGDYLFAAPMEDEQALDPTFWAPVQVQKVNSVQEFSIEGREQSNLCFVDENQFNRYCTPTGSTRPSIYTWSSMESVSVLSFFPVPDEVRYYAVNFVLRYPPMYAADGNIYNKFLTYAPELLELKCLVEFADYFDEPEMSARFETKLYGAAGGDANEAARRRLGEVGKVINEGLRRNTEYQQRFNQQTRNGMSGFQRRMTSRFGWFADDGI